MPSPPDLNGLTALQQIIVLVISTIGGVGIWLWGQLKPKADPTTAPNIIALENDRRDAEILDKVREIMEARNIANENKISELREKIQELAVSVARLESARPRR